MPTNYCLACKTVLIAAAVMACGSACRTTVQSEVNLPSRVIALKGRARAFPEESPTSKTVEVGDVFKPGCTIETADNSYLVLSLGEGAKPLVRTGPANPPNTVRYLLSGGQVVGTKVIYDPAVDANIAVRISSSAVLEIETLAGKRCSDQGQPVRKMRLDLHAGKIFGRVKNRRNGSEYEIKFPFGIVRVRAARFEIDSDGLVKISEGAARVTLADRNLTNEVVAGHGFNCRTGETYLLPSSGGYPY